MTKLLDQPSGAVGHWQQARMLQPLQPYNWELIWKPRRSSAALPSQFKVNSWLWIHIWFHYNLNEYTCMNLLVEMNLYMWILTYDFTISFFMIMNSYLNSYNEFINDLMIMNSYATFQDLWIRIWIHAYEEYREIIPEIKCSKVPDAHWPARVSESVSQCYSGRW